MNFNLPQGPWLIVYCNNQHYCLKGTKVGLVFHVWSLLSSWIYGILKLCHSICFGLQTILWTVHRFPQVFVRCYTLCEMVGDLMHNKFHLLDLKLYTCNKILHILSFHFKLYVYHTKTPSSFRGVLWVTLPTLSFYVFIE